MRYLHAYVLILGLGVVIASTNDDPDDDLVNYHKENQHTYEVLAAVSLSSMLLILIAAFCGGCYFQNFFWLSESPVDTSDHSMSVSTAPLNKSAVASHTLTVNRLKPPTSSNFTLVSTLQKCLEVYCEQHGNVDIPSHFIIPSVAPWPIDAWGVDFGTVLASIQSNLSGGGIRTFNSDMPLSSAQHSQAHHSSNGHAHDEHRAETWYELFYDLVFVAAALQLGMIIKYDHRIVGIIKAAILFLMLRSTWDHLTAYQNSFHASDLTHMAYYLLQSMAAFVIALHLQIEDSEHHDNQHSWNRYLHQRPIALMASICRILTTLMYLRAIFSKSQHREYLFRIIIHTSLSAFIFGASMLCPVDDEQRWYLYVWAAGIVCERPLMHFIAYMQDKSDILIAPAHIGHLIARQGMFFMLILGEAVIQLVQAHGSFDFASYVRALLGFAIVFNVGNVYYEQQQREPHRHVLFRSAGIGHLWIDMNSLLSMCVLFFAVGVKVVFHGFDEAQILRDELLMCGFAAISLVIMYCMNIMHRGVEYNFRRSYRIMGAHTFCFVVAGACAAIPFLVRSTTMTVVVLHILTSMLVLQDVLGRTAKVEILRSLMNIDEARANKAWSSGMDSSISSDVWNLAMDSSATSQIGLTELKARK